MNQLTAATPILDFQHKSIQQLIKQRGWNKLEPVQAVTVIYYFIRDEIHFGYNRDDAIAASEVLANGYGQCNTKGSLFMALVRALNIPCRLHGFTIYNSLQQGAIPRYLMPLAPKRILHSWVEVLLDGQWLNVEGFIIDKAFLSQVQRGFSQCNSFSGYGIAVPCLQQPNNEFNNNHTYIQAEGIADDFGVFASPDQFYAKHGSNLQGIRKLAYRYVLRHLINVNVKRIRQYGI